MRASLKLPRFPIELITQTRDVDVHVSLGKRTRCYICMWEFSRFLTPSSYYKLANLEQFNISINSIYIL